MTRISVLNGPNLNLVGTREPVLYGSSTLAEIEAMVRSQAAVRGVEIAWLQSNHEGELVEAIQSLHGDSDGAIVNFGGYTHTSVAIRDAFLAKPIPFVEVHLSNLFKREEFRHRSMTGDLALGVIAGFGPRGYLLALDALVGALTDA